jgi:DNA-binding beta-propeller fold protein YncE
MNTTLDFNEESNMNAQRSLFSSHAIASLAVVGVTILSFACTGGQVNNSGVPNFEVDPQWPKPLPNNWIIGQVSGVAVDSRDHVWIVHRPSSLTPNEIGSAQEPPISACCDPAPPVIEFDQEGNVVQAWGGPETHDPWPNAEHGISVDHQDNVWIASSGASADVVLKFSSDGERLLQIGEFGETGGSDNTTLLGGPTDIAVDPSTDEVYISDGYGNRRVIVYDAETGEYKRHWGAYGETPDDAELAPYDPDAEPLRTYRNPVHSVRISNDGLVYVSDRVGNRFQVFQKNGEFVTETFIASQTLSMGSVWDIDFSPDAEQTYMYVADGTNNKVWILTRNDHEIAGEFGRNGRYAGQFHWLHSIAVDSHGNIYTGEVDTGMRVQRFVRR